MKESVLKRSPFYLSLCVCVYVCVRPCVCVCVVTFHFNYLVWSYAKNIPTYCVGCKLRITNKVTE